MDTPTTPRAALIDLADRIDAGQIDRLPDAPLVRLAGRLRRAAERYSDEPEASPTGPRSTTARAALLAFADELDDILDPAVIPPSAIATITHMARERARSLTDHPASADDTVGIPAVAHLRAEIERLRLQLAGEPLATELVGAPALDVDQQLRVHAVMAAAVRLQHQPYTPGGASEDVLDLARILESYLRGDR